MFPLLPIQPPQNPSGTLVEWGMAKPVLLWEAPLLSLQPPPEDGALVLLLLQPLPDQLLFSLCEKKPGNPRPGWAPTQTGRFLVLVFACVASLHVNSSSAGHSHC